MSTHSTRTNEENAIEQKKNKNSYECADEFVCKQNSLGWNCGPARKYFFLSFWLLLLTGPVRVFLSLEMKRYIICRAVDPQTRQTANSYVTWKLTKNMTSAARRALYPIPVDTSFFFALLFRRTFPFFAAVDVVLPHFVINGLLLMRNIRAGIFHLFFLQLFPFFHFIFIPWAMCAFMAQRIHGPTHSETHFWSDIFLWTRMKREKKSNVAVPSEINKYIDRLNGQSDGQGDRHVHQRVREWRAMARQQ